MNINSFLNRLAEDAGRNYKIELLELKADDTLLKEVIRLALDPLTQFYQRKIPAYTTGKVGMNLEQGLNRLFPLASRMVTGNAAIAHLTETLSSLSADDAKVIERIIEKDLRCGVSTSTANKVWPDLVMDYPCMLCSQYEEKLINKIKFPAYVQLKMDGMRFNAIVHNGVVEFRSRNGKEIQLLGNLEEEFILLAQGVDCVFDGELLVKDKGIILDRQTGNGILNKANKGTIKTDEARKVHATVWDVIPYSDFVNGVCNVPYQTRFETISSFNLPEKIHLVETTEVYSLDAAQKIFEEYLNEGQEGIILKSQSGIWENKRAKHQIKFKGELECDLEIVAVEEGTGKYAGKLGALVCASRHENGQRVAVSVGSGFNDAHRDEFWSIRDSLIGKIVAVKYNAKIVNKQGEISLFLPIFIEMRNDKDVADLNKDIK
jgi:ATP-dependent DNA ligase